MKTLKFLLIYITGLDLLCLCSCLCDRSDANGVDILCYDLIKNMEQSLLQDKGNIFRLQNTFFYSPTASPVLLKVVYNVTYNENITSRYSATENSSLEIPYCDPNFENSSITFNDTLVIHGWTSSGVYTLFHPGVLNLMQLQLPYILLNLIQRLSKQTTDGPEADSFLWDGSYELPTLHLNLRFSLLTCIPSQELFDAVLNKLTSQMKLYAENKPIISFETTIEDLGFNLPNSRVTASGIADGDDTLVVNIYTLFAVLVYLGALIAFFISYCKKVKDYRVDKTISMSRVTGSEANANNEPISSSEITGNEANGRSATNKKKTENFIQTHRKLAPGAAIVAALSVSSELLFRFVRCITWSVYIGDSRATISVVWLPQLWFLMVVLLPTIVFHLVYLYIGYKKESSTENKGLFKIWMAFKHKYHIHIILVIFIFIYLLVYSFFPTFILIFAYPTKMIAVVTFVLAFIFSMIVFFALIVHFYFYLDFLEWKVCYTILFISLSTSLAFMVIGYFFGMLYILLYVLVIGRASVVSTGPLAILSLLPSILLSGLAWITKTTFLKEAKDEQEPGNNCEQSTTTDSAC